MKAVTQPTLGSVSYEVEMGAQKVRLRRGHKAFCGASEISFSLGEIVPLLGGEEVKHRRVLGRSCAVAKVEGRHNDARWMDIRWQQSRVFDKGIDESALASLDLTDNRDPTGNLSQLLLRFQQERNG